MRAVPLSGGRLHLPSGAEALVDDEDYDRVAGMKWRLFFANGRRLFAVSGRATLLHRFILGVPDGIKVDHLNGDGLDNQRANLRALTQSQVLAKYWARDVCSDSPHRYMKGVSLVEGRSRPWRATISVEGRKKSLGYHTSEEEAARAYDEAARRFFGEFARTNFSYEGGA